MNVLMIKRLVLKDWYLHRLAITLMTGGIALGIALLALPGNTIPLIGLNLIISLFVALTFYLPLSTVLSERTEKTLPFVLSLPTSPAEYTTAKIVANVALFLVPLAGVAFGYQLIIQTEFGQMLGISVYHSHILLLGLLIFFSFVLGFSLITESMGWTIALIVLTMFVCSSVLTQLVPRVPVLRQFIADIAKGETEYFIALSIELGIILGLLALTYWIQIRKRDFL
jgi:ABC-2 type transport system permease protein